MQMLSRDIKCRFCVAERDSRLPFIDRLLHSMIVSFVYSRHSYPDNELEAFFEAGGAYKYLPKTLQHPYIKDFLQKMYHKEAGKNFVCLCTMQRDHSEDGGQKNLLILRSNSFVFFWVLHFLLHVHIQTLTTTVGTDSS
jgi:hypothetical protein